VLSLESVDDKLKRIGHLLRAIADLL